MQTLTQGDLVLVVLEPGEEIVASVGEAAAAHQIRAGWVSGIGSLSEVELAFFDPDRKEYLPRLFEEPMEIGNLTGNISRMEDESHVHLHATVCGPELIAFTGHLNRGVVGTACEIYIRRLGREVERIRDPASGFNPLKLR
jgi:predicted DNA-binding protein with PD1-like motif